MNSTSVIKGVIGGLIATVPMTLVMNYLYRRLPAAEKRRLPPGEVAERSTRLAGVDDIASDQLEVLSYLEHFSYGAMTGGLYGAFERPEHASAARGAAFGLLVWAGSYFGWMRLFPSLDSASHQTPRRHRLLLISHLVWGAALGSLQRKRRS
jgi:hypothetical protein